MRLLICAQTLDSKDTTLGFFHTWVRELAAHVEHIHVIALSVGETGLPENVQVHSLGKSAPSVGASRLMARIRFALRFLFLAWRLRKEYDAVFVHMNQEYVLLGGFFWWRLGKRVYMWRNHYAGSLWTKKAGAWCRKVFYTSKSSFTASFKNAVRMPVGILPPPHDLPEIRRIPHSILSLGRIAPSKRIEMLLDALLILKARGLVLPATIVGPTLPEHLGYKKELQERIVQGRIVASLKNAVPEEETHALYRAHDIFVNMSPSGMFDKTIFSSVVNGCIALASSTDYKEFAGEEYFFTNAETLADRIAFIVEASESSRAQHLAHLKTIVEPHMFSRLIPKLLSEMQ